MTLGAEPKKMAAAGILTVGAVVAVYTQLIAPSDDIPRQPSRPAASAVPVAAQPAPLPDAAALVTATPRPPGKKRERAGVREWVPTLKPKRPEDRPDPSTVDPRPRTDLLAKLQTVTVSGGMRSLFEFGSAPPPPSKPIPDIKILPGKGGAKKGPEAEAANASPVKPADPPKAPPPPIPLKFYGFVDGTGGKQAFFLNGEDIFPAREGQTVQSRYKILRIGPTSAEVEDVPHKNRQTIRLEEPPAS